uniref:BPTI/Kunitz inhibitor domain-containing protein n=1 Tax=Heterorhabditis bacteriophora TaxID=37862 RepID=A0A1I7XKE8_HETBA
MDRGRIVQCHTQMCPHTHYCHYGVDSRSTVCCVCLILSEIKQSILVLMQFTVSASFCLMPKDFGPCNGNHTRYAYDKDARICKKFMFGGCQGNLNNFESLEKCTEICCDKGYF